MTSTAFSVGGAGGGAFVPLATLTASSSATLAFTNIFNASYYQYLFQFTNILPATDNVYLQFQLGTGAGPSYVATGYTYQAISTVNTSVSGVSATTGAGTSVVLTTTSGSFGLSNVAPGTGGSVYVVGANGSSAVASGTSYIGGGFYTGAVGPTFANGSWNVTAALFTAIKFYMSSGNIASGIIDVYGVLPG